MVEFMRENRGLLDADLGFDPFDLAAGAQPINEMAEAVKSPYVYGIIFRVRLGGKLWLVAISSG